MSYRRQVHCRYCGDSGHNVNGCAKAKEYVKNNPNSWYAHKAAQRAESAKHRKCSYCNNEGHNRKTCSHIMSDMIKVAGVNQDFRKKFLDNIIKKNGIAPGALINVDNTSGYVSDGTYRYDLKDKMALVTDISFDDVKYPNKDSGCQVVKVQYMDLYDYGGNRLAETFLQIPNWFILGKEQPVEKWYRNSLDFKVISPGHYDMDDEEKWVKDKDVIQRICDEYGNHADLQYAFDRIDLNK
jgi:hypothetical protein